MPSHGLCEKDVGCTAPGIFSGISCSCLHGTPFWFYADLLLDGDTIKAVVVPEPGTTDTNPLNDSLIVTFE